MRIKKAFVIFLLFYVAFLFSTLSKAYAASITNYYDSVPAGATRVADSFCSGGLQQCWNSWAVGQTDCGTQCNGGDAWHKYEYDSCYADPFDDTVYFNLLTTASLACSTGDKYNSSNPPVMDAGKCSATAGTCDVGGPYKTCCSGGVPVAARSFPVDPYAPNEADCGGNTEVRCGAPGEPACGIAACGGAPTATPIPPSEPPATPTPVTCSGLDYGACGSCSTCGGPANECETHIKTDCTTECVWDPTKCRVPPTPTPTPAPTCPSPTNLNGDCDLTRSQALRFTWTGNSACSGYAIRIDDQIDGWGGDNPLPNDTVNNNASSPFTRSGIAGHSYTWWLHAIRPDGIYVPSAGVTGNSVVCPAPTTTPTPIPTAGPNNLSVVPETNTQSQTGAWQQFSITKNTTGFPNTNVGFYNQGVYPGSIGDFPSSDWTRPLGNCTFSNDGSGFCTWTPSQGTSITDSHTFGLFSSTGELLAVDSAAFIPPGITPTPTQGPQGCMLVPSPSTVSPRGSVSVSLSGPAGTYTMTCPDGSSRGPGSPGDPWLCSTPSQPGTYQVSVSGKASCSANVRVATTCRIQETMQGPFIYTYKDYVYNNTNYADVANQWPQYFWCPNGGSCTYGTRGSQPVSNAKRNDSSSCGYTTIGAATGLCRLARFPVPSNYSSMNPFNQPLSLGTTDLPNVVIHADSVCGSYTAVTGSDGQTSSWRDSSGAVIGFLPRTVGSSSSDQQRVSYDVWAEVPSGRRFTRGIYYHCSGGPCNDLDGADKSKGPTDQARFENFDTGSPFTSHSFRFGFTNPGYEPVCTGVSASPLSGPRPLTVAFSNAQGYDPDGGTIVGFGWDFDGNGIIDRETTVNAVTHTYNGNRGTFYAKVYVKDNTQLFSPPVSACTKDITVSCNTLTVSPNPIVMAPGQTLTVTPSGIDGDNVYWTSTDTTIAEVTGSSCQEAPNPDTGDTGGSGGQLLRFLARLFHLPSANACSGNTPVAVSTSGQSVQVQAKREGTVDLSVYVGGAFNCSSQRIAVPVIVRTSPWFQGKGGDMRIDAGFNDPIPPTISPPASAYASLDGSNSTPGIIYSGSSSYSFCFGGTCQEKASSTRWVAGGGTSLYPEVFTPVNAGVIRTSYGYMTTTAKQSGITPTDLTTVSGCTTLSNCDLPTTLPNGVYRANGNVTLTSASNTYTFPIGKNFVILVNGNLTIGENVVVPNGSTATFSVSGNIIVDKLVGSLPAVNCDPITHAGCNIEGFYSADGNVILDGNGASACSTTTTSDDDKRLNIAGSIVTNAKLQGGILDNKRDLCESNPIVPSFSIFERPDFIINAPAFIKHPNFIWQEVAP